MPQVAVPATVSNGQYAISVCTPGAVPSDATCSYSGFFAITGGSNTSIDTNSTAVNGNMTTDVGKNSTTTNSTLPVNSGSNAMQSAGMVILSGSLLLSLL